MRYLPILLICLSACSPSQPAPDTAPLAEYECAVVGRHGVYAKLRGSWPSERHAKADAEKAFAKFADKLPSSYFVQCFEIDTD